MSFDYILQKIRDAEFVSEPFPHLDIKNFLSEEHLNLIKCDDQIHFDEMSTDEALCRRLIETGWDVQQFPGCTTNFEEFKQQQLFNPNGWIDSRLDSFGMTFRLHSYQNETIRELLSFMNGDVFHNALRSKFDVVDSTTIISAIQKNLSGYEISPHPDIKQKCLTYLLNINNSDEIETMDCHTHLMELDEEHKYVEDVWVKYEDSIETCHLPWDWCNTVKTMNENNSIVLFHTAVGPPSIHAIKLDYDHLKFQRTQIYGNLMYSESKAGRYGRIEAEDLHKWRDFEVGRES